MSLTPIQEIRLNVADNDPDFQILTDDEYTYLLNKYGSVRISTLQAARIILFKLASNNDETIFDVGIIKGSQYFRNYREALMLLMKDEQFSSVSQAMPYAGGQSKQDVTDNRDNTDVIAPSIERAVANESEYYDYFDDENPYNTRKYLGGPDRPFGS